MPTAGKMTAAVLFGILTWYASELIKPTFPEGTDLGFFTEINTAIGIICGWIVAGSRAGTGYNAAVSYGLTATAALVFWGLLLQSGGVMIRQSMRVSNSYGSAFEAVIDVFNLMLEHGAQMATPAIIGTLVIGGIVAGLITEFIGSRYP